MGIRAHFRDHHLDNEGEPVAGASVYVYNQHTTTPITATIYANDSDHPTAAATTLTNPFTTGTDGKYEFFLDTAARVDIKIVSTGLQNITRTVDVTRTPNDAGVTDHGLLTGLGDDDHPQYHNDARGDARYGRLAAANTFTAAQAIRGTDTNGDLTLKRDYVVGTPAVNDIVARFYLGGEDSAGGEANYAEVRGVISDPTDLSEDGLLDLLVASNATLSRALRISHDGTRGRIAFGNDLDGYITNHTTSPEGVVTAGPGAVCQDQTGKLWLKTTGTGTTGWTDISRHEEAKETASTATAQSVTWTTAFAATPVVTATPHGTTEPGFCSVSARSTTAATVTFTHNAAGTALTTVRMVMARAGT